VSSRDDAPRGRAARRHRNVVRRDQHMLPSGLLPDLGGGSVQEIFHA